MERQGPNRDGTVAVANWARDPPKEKGPALAYRGAVGPTRRTAEDNTYRKPSNWRENFCGWARKILTNREATADARSGEKAHRTRESRLVCHPQQPLKAAGQSLLGDVVEAESPSDRPPPPVWGKSRRGGGRFAEFP